MNPRVVSFAAMTVSILTGLCFAAGGLEIGGISRDTANFAGIAMGSLAAILWIGAGALRAKQPSSDVSR